MGFMLRLIAWISLILGPIALLMFFQLQFLPYHDEIVSWWQRIAVVIDLVLLWVVVAVYRAWHELLAHAGEIFSAAGSPGWSC